VLNFLGAKFPGKFNNSLLTDTEYVQKVKNKLSEYKERYSKASDHCLIWDTAKAEIRGITISHATYVNRNRKEKQTMLDNELTNLEKKLADNPDANILQQYATKKNELQQINNHMTQFIDQNEANSKLFLGLERLKAKTKSITKLINENNDHITDPKEILALEKSFYENLYKNTTEYQETESIESEKILSRSTRNQSLRQR
jgi:hypothetical protein